MKILALKEVCYDFNIPDEVIQIIMDNVKSAFLKNKICRLFNGYLKPLDDFHDRKIERCKEFNPLLLNTDTTLSLFEEALEADYPQLYVWGGGGEAPVDGVENQLDWDEILHNTTGYYPQTDLISFIVKSLDQGKDCIHTLELMEESWEEENEVPGYRDN